MIAAAALASLLAAQAAAAADGPAAGANPRAKQQDAAQADQLERLDHDIEKIDRAIAETKQIIRISLDAPYLPDLTFHLAEHYVQRSRLEHARGMVSQGQSGIGLEGSGSSVVMMTKKLAIESYQKLLADFPDYEHRDQVLFFKGHEFRELGEYPSMTQEYQSLIDHFPRSKWAQRARLTLGDFHFDKGEEDEAEPFYQDVLRQPDGPASVTARYRLGWIRIHQEKFKEALELFKEAIVVADQHPAPRTGGSGINTRREALLAMAWPYAETRPAAASLAFFRALADSQASYVDVLRKLAARYTIKNQNAMAALILREVVIVSSDPESHLDAVPKIVNAVGELPEDQPLRYAEVARDEQALTKTYLELIDRPSVVRHRPGAPVIDEKKIRQEYEVHGRDLVTRAQKFAQAGNDLKLEGHVAEAYESYLDAFADSPQATKMKVNLAGSLFDASDYYPAGREYERIAEAQGARLSRGDVYNAIVAYWRALDDDAKHRAADPERNGVLDKLQLLRAREGLKQLGGFFVQHFAQDDKVPEVRFNVARMYYQQGEFARASELLAAWVRDFPGHRDAATAGRLAMDALYKLEELDKLATVADAFARNDGITDAGFRAEAGKLAEAARQRKVEVAVIGAGEANFSKAMLGEWEKHKGSKEGEEFLYAGYSKYKSQGDVANTFLFGDKLMGAYPNSRRAQDVLATLGAFAAHVADYERAAFMYEEYQRRFAKSPQALPLLKNAAEMRRLLGEGRQAEQDLTTLMAQSPSERAEASARLLEMYAAQASWPQLEAAAGGILADGPQVAGCFYAGLAELHQNKLPQAHQHFACAAQGPARGEGDEALMARAAFELGRVAQITFAGLNFSGAQGAEAVLARKLKLMQAAEEAYMACIHTGDSRWALASTYELSRLYKQFGDFVVSAPAPANVSAEQYKQALSQQAEPYYDRARQTLAACGQKAGQLRLLSAFGRACIEGQDGEVDDLIGTPFRDAGSQDARYQADLKRIRQSLSKNVRNIDVLRSMARRAMQARDWHYARLILSSMAEMGGGHGTDGWMGLILWQLNEPQEAFTFLDRARKSGNDTASLNLAGLLWSFGYRAQARKIMPERSHIERIDLQSPDVHPSARAMLRGVARGGP